MCRLLRWRSSSGRSPWRSDYLPRWPSPCCPSRRAAAAKRHGRPARRALTGPHNVDVGRLLLSGSAGPHLPFQFKLMRTAQQQQQPDTLLLFPCTPPASLPASMPCPCVHKTCEAVERASLRNLPTICGCLEPQLLRLPGRSQVAFILSCSLRFFVPRPLSPAAAYAVPPGSVTPILAPFVSRPSLALLDRLRAPANTCISPKGASGLLGRHCALPACRPRMQAPLSTRQHTHPPAPETLPTLALFLLCFIHPPSPLLPLSPRTGRGLHARALGLPRRAAPL